MHLGGKYWGEEVTLKRLIDFKASEETVKLFSQRGICMCRVVAVASVVGAEFAAILVLGCCDSGGP